MSKKDFIPIPPPAPLPEPEFIDPAGIKRLFDTGEIDLLCIMGPTASGKTAYAVRMARALNELYADEGRHAEILSADSRQVFRGMDIGTGKDIGEYGDIPYHLIDIADPGERYNICEYQKDFSEAYSSCLERAVIPILCGGSGLYVEAVTKPEYELRDVSRSSLVPPRNTYYIATLVDRDTRRARIDRRLDQRLEQGMIEEIKGLLDRGVPADVLIRYGLEYKFVTLYVQGELTYDRMHEGLRFAIHQFAKRQMTWLRGMEKDGIVFHWTECR